MGPSEFGLPQIAHAARRSRKSIAVDLFVKGAPAAGQNYHRILDWLHAAGPWEMVLLLTTCVSRLALGEIQELAARIATDGSRVVLLAQSAAITSEPSAREIVIPDELALDAVWLRAPDRSPTVREIDAWIEWSRALADCGSRIILEMPMATAAAHKVHERLVNVFGGSYYGTVDLCLLRHDDELEPSADLGIGVCRMLPVPVVSARESVLACASPDVLTGQGDMGLSQPWRDHSDIGEAVDELIRTPLVSLLTGVGPDVVRIALAGSAVPGGDEPLDGMCTRCAALRHHLDQHGDELRQMLLAMSLTLREVNGERTDGG